MNSQMVNVSVKENIVFKKGTPRIKNQRQGIVLLTGGGGNDNYWHWLFDVCRLGICENKIDLIISIFYYQIIEENFNLKH